MEQNKDIEIIEEVDEYGMTEADYEAEYEAEIMEEYGEEGVNWLHMSEEEQLEAWKKDYIKDFTPEYIAKLNSKPSYQVVTVYHDGGTISHPDREMTTKETAQNMVEQFQKDPQYKEVFMVSWKKRDLHLDYLPEEIRSQILDY